MEEIADFLVHFPPFDQLAQDDLLRVSEAVTGRSYSAGTDILIEDGRCV
jgi:signal-transduction protein with cAMP-binding, CBS, and nucleotidyltransferase domain